MTPRVTATAEEINHDLLGYAEAYTEGKAERSDADGGAPPTPPSAPPPARRRGYGGGRIPRWQQLLMLGVLVLLSFVIGTLIGGAVEHRIERRRQAQEHA